METNKKKGPGKRGSLHYSSTEKKTDQVVKDEIKKTDQVVKDEIKKTDQVVKDEIKKTDQKIENRDNTKNYKKNNTKEKYKSNHKYDNKKKRYKDEYINYKKEITILKKNQREIKIKLSNSPNQSQDIKPLLFSLTAIVFSLISVLISIFTYIKVKG